MTNLLDDLVRRAALADYSNDSLQDTLIILKPNEHIIRGYVVTKKINNRPASLIMCDLVAACYPLDLNLTGWYNVHFKSDKIPFVDKRTEKVFYLNRSDGYPSFVRVVYYPEQLYVSEELTRVDQALLDDLNPELQREYTVNVSPDAPDLPTRSKNPYLLGEIPNKFDTTGEQAMLAMCAMLEIRTNQMAYHPHPDELGGAFCNKFNCPVCKQLEYTDTKYRQSKISKYVPSWFFVEGMQLDDPQLLRIAKEWWKRNRLVKPLAEAQLLMAQTTLMSNLEKLDKTKNKEEIAGIQQENAIIMESISNQQEPEHNLFRVGDDGGNYPGESEEEKESLEVTTIAARAALATAEAEVNLRLMKEKEKEKKDNGSTSL